MNSRSDIYRELALFVNKLMLDDEVITYNLYKMIKDGILKRH